MVDATILDDPVEAAKAPEAFLKAAMRWHFDPDTGSRFWLERAALLDFDPRTDIETFEDLLRFPNLTSDLRDALVEDLIPQGYGPRPEVVRIVESGGTTGAPKRFVIMRDWWDLLVGACVRHLDRHDWPRDCNVLTLVPSGPHAAGEQWRTVHAARGCKTFAIDLDPRWIKKLIESGDSPAAYIDHIVDQAEHHLISQDIRIIQGTPPLIAQLCRRDALVERIEQSVQAIQWGGAHMDADSRHLYRTALFPGIKLAGGYGTTMAGGGGAQERPGLGLDDPCIFDPFWPFVTFFVVDPEEQTHVPLGDRGQLVVNHVSRSFFLPHNLERDTAARMSGPDGQIGDSLADIAPLAEFEGARAIEGVY